MMKRRPYEESDVSVLMKVFISYVQWCIGKLPDGDRRELEELTPQLRLFYPHPGEWYEIMEAEWDLAPSGRAMIQQAYEEMSDEVTPEEFTVQWTEAFFRGIDRMSKRQKNHARSKPASRRKQH
jgi:hypothetical protein